MKTRVSFLGVLFGTLLLSGTIILSCNKDDDNGNDGTGDPGDIATENLVAYFPFDGNGNEEINNLEATASSAVSFVAGRRGQAYKGADSAFLLYDLPSGNKLRTLEAFTISMWFYGTPAIDGVAPVPGILQINGTTDPVWGNLCLTQDRMPDAADSLNIKIVFHKEGAIWNNQFVGFSNNKFVENLWFHLVLTYDNVSSKYRVYVNGDSLNLNEGITDRWAAGDDVVPRPPLGDLAFSNATQLVIGGWMQKVIGASTDEWMGYFTGQMDELRIYDKGLTSDEVDSLFEAEVNQLD
jgi:hypothetical protein